MFLHLNADALLTVLTRVTCFVLNYPIHLTTFAFVSFSFVLLTINAINYSLLIFSFIHSQFDEIIFSLIDTQLYSNHGKIIFDL